LTETALPDPLVLLPRLTCSKPWQRPQPHQTTRPTHHPVHRFRI